MKTRCILLVMIGLWAGLAAQADDKLSLIGWVKESAFKTDLPKAWVWTIGENGERVDSLPIGQQVNPAQFVLTTTRQDSVYVFEVGCEGCTTATFTYTVKNAKRGWGAKSMPPFYLDRAPHKLKELTVTTSKVKFYHRGDTIVYNADAFQLAEGSMLDALIQQLPGAELSSDGRISVNGEFVETLLLDGKPFFDGNNNLVLKNFGAYMVKNVEVYKRHTDFEKFLGTTAPPTHLTMNVKLKKEYNNGWIANVQGGYGTDARYLGRLFAAWFKPHSRVGIVANLNNLNDTRTPGQSDNWAPEQMPSGTRRYQMAGLTYNHSHPENKYIFNGDFIFESNRLATGTSTDRTNFFSDANTYDYSRTLGRNKDYKLYTKHEYKLRFNRINSFGYLIGSYNREDRNSSALSASFNREQGEMTMQRLEAINSVLTAESLSALINRAATMSSGKEKNGSVNWFHNSISKLTFVNAMLRFESDVKFDTRKRDLWDDYDILYGNNGEPGGSHRRNFTHSPDNNFNWETSLMYVQNVENIFFTVGYNYLFSRKDRDSYMYSLDRLADMGVYGTLPEDYASTFDPANSFTSTQWDNRHSGVFKIGYNLSIKDDFFQ